ncbi:hypothetical protein BDB01DRAFT_840497 [Pilobolus umbonatus]|nr:hypothetical protein BDB01DRAFT_840497 [Pilobolus umbonatus]
METFLTKYLHGNVTRVSVRGSEKGPDGLEGETPSWLRRALADISIEVPFPGATNTDMIESLSLTHIQIDFSSSGHPLISGDALALLKKPEEMLFHMDIETIRPHVFLYLDANSTSPFGSVQPPRPARARTEDIEENKMKVTCRLSRAPFIVLPGGQKDYEEFMYRVLHRKRSKIYMRGTSEATIQSPFGRLTIQDLQFRGEIETQGLQGMNNPGPKVTSFSLLKGYPDALHSQTTLDIFSPSDIHINLGEVTMMLLYNGKIIGNTTITELLLAPGVHNSLTASTWLYGHSFEDRSALIRFIGKYISNVFATDLLTISGDHSNVSTSSYLNKFLRQLKFEVLPPVFDKEPLLADVKMNILSSSVIMSLRNPFDGIMMTIMKINATAYHEVYNIGTMTADFTQKGSGWKGPLILPPPSCEIQCQSNIIQSEKIPIETKKMGLDVIKKALGGSIDVSVDSVVEVKLDEFTLPSLVYHQNNITAKVRKGF